MLYIEKGPAPEALTQEKRNGVKRYDELQTSTKDAIKMCLLTEQYHLCAYCMQRISLQDMSIEHYIP